MSGKCIDSEGKQAFKDEEQKRASQANDYCCSECQKSGIKVSSWQDFSAYMEYIDGKIGETQLTEKAKSEIAEFSKDFGKYLVLEKEESKHSEDDEEKKKRAKRAVKIYREVCSEAGLTVCFFHGFISWSDYVEGKITESEFYERVKAEIKEMAAKAN